MARRVVRLRCAAFGNGLSAMSGSSRRKELNHEAFCNLHLLRVGEVKRASLKRVRGGPFGSGPQGEVGFIIGTMTLVSGKRHRDDDATTKPVWDWPSGRRGFRIDAD